jgi:hypothetical protein
VTQFAGRLIAKEREVVRRGRPGICDATAFAGDEVIAGFHWRLLS